jgi:hypothetical protein
MICFTVAVLANEPNLIMGFGVLVIITKLDMKTPSRSWIIDEWVPFILATFTEDGLYGIANKHGILVDKSLDNQNF